MKSLEIAVIGENLKVARAIKSAIIGPKNHSLRDLWISCSVYNNPKDYEKILGETPDLIILDSNSTQSPIENLELNIIRKIKETNHSSPIIFSSKDSNAITYATQNEIADGYISNPNESEQIREIVRKKIKRPLNIAIIGLGKLGLGFMQSLADNSNAKTIQAFSKNMFEEYRHIKNLERIRDNKKISLKNTLEDALSNTDCAL